MDFIGSLENAGAIALFLKQSILSDLWWFALLAILSLIAYGIFSFIAQSIIGFFQLRLNKYLCLDKAIKINGHTGHIRSIGFFSLTVETNEGFIFIPTKGWRDMQIVILKETVEKNRRTEDEKK